MAEARIITDAARRQALTLRLIGGLAVRRYCGDLAFVDREFSDIDLVGLSRQSGRLGRLFAELGYEENRYVSQATSGSQSQYVKPWVLLESRAHFAKRPHSPGQDRGARRDRPFTRHYGLGGSSCGVARTPECR